MTAPIRYACARCDFKTPFWSRAQEHANESKHARVGMSESELLGGTK